VDNNRHLTNTLVSRIDQFLYAWRVRAYTAGHRNSIDCHQSVARPKDIVKTFQKNKHGIIAVLIVVLKYFII
jgi:hypothetical protein